MTCPLHLLVHKEIMTRYLQFEHHRFLFPEHTVMHLTCACVRACVRACVWLCVRVVAVCGWLCVRVVIVRKESWVRR